MTDIIIPQRFRGPEGMANGGYISGVVAEALGEPAQVRLYAPTPLDKQMRLEREDGRAALYDGDTLLVEAVPRAHPLQIEPPDAPDEAAIARAAPHFPSADEHMAPGCFVCGVERSHEDALCLFTGQDPETGTAIARWEPVHDLAAEDGLIATPILWAALDCPSYFGLAVKPGPALLAGFAAAIARRPAPQERLRVNGWRLGAEGRKQNGASVIHDEAGDVLAVAKALWITLDELPR